MGYVLDAIILIIISIFVLISAKRGFVRVFIEAAGFVAAIILTLTISTPLGNAAYDKIVEPRFIESVSAKSAEGIELTVDKVWDTLPAFIKNSAQKFGDDKQNVNDSITEDLQSGTAGAIEKVSKEVIKPITVKVLSLCFSVILMCVLLFAVKLIAKGTNKLFSKKILGKINMFLGGAVGLCEGTVFALFFVSAVLLIFSFCENGFWIFTYKNIYNSYIFRFFTGLTPFDLFKY